MGEWEGIVVGGEGNGRLVFMIGAGDWERGVVSGDKERADEEWEWLECGDRGGVPA